MALFYQMILCVLVRTSLGNTDPFTLSIEKHNITVMYGDCQNIPYTVQLQSGSSLSYNAIWFREINGKQEILESQNQSQNVLKLPLLPLGEHKIGLRLELEDMNHFINPKKKNEKKEKKMNHLFAERVQVSVSALTKKPEVKISNLKEGHSATLNCTAPKLCLEETPNIIWVRSNVRTVQSNKRFKHVLQITPKAEDHNTSITCQLRYKHTVIEKTETLKVQYSPRISNSSKCFLKDSSIFCRCASHGNPQPTISWLLPCGCYKTTYASNDSETVEETVQILGSYNHSTIQCVSRNYLGNATITLKTQNLKSLTNLTTELKNMAMKEKGFTLTVPWMIIVASLSLNLAMFAIVFYLYKQAHKKKCSEDVNMYASLRKTTADHEYSVISPH